MSKVCGKSEGEIYIYIFFSQNTLLWAYYLNVCVMIRFELKLQVKFRKNKNYSNVICKFSV